MRTRHDSRRMAPVMVVPDTVPPATVEPIGIGLVPTCAFTKTVVFACAKAMLGTIADIAQTTAKDKMDFLIIKHSFDERQ